jgi:hypothetical protein
VVTSPVEVATADLTTKDVADGLSLGESRLWPAAALLVFAFTQQMSPELAPPGWRHVFLDNLHLGFTNATAFSPTDVLPLTHRASTRRSCSAPSRWPSSA